MAERNYPNDYFAWFNDDQRLAILSLDTTSTDSSERTTEKYITHEHNYCFEHLRNCALYVFISNFHIFRKNRLFQKKFSRFFILEKNKHPIAFNWKSEKRRNSIEVKFLNAFFFIRIF